MPKAPNYTTRVETVTSTANPLVKEVRRAIGRGSLTLEGHCIAEGFHLLEEALRSGCAVPVAMVAEGARHRFEAAFGMAAAERTLVLPDTLFETIATTEATQGLVSLVHPPVWTLDRLFEGQSLVVVLDGIQDPGNAGSVVRAAEAFGATGVIFVKGAVSPYNPKTLRASAGSLFRIPYMAGLEAGAVGSALRKLRVVVYAAMPWSGSEHLAEDVDFGRRCAIIVGGEGRGVGGELQAMAERVAIPTAGVESLNAAVAAAVLLYETRRQRGRSESL